MCGENRVVVQKLHAQVGSSPRVRGKRHGLRWCHRRNGLIPACAGKTNLNVSAHPHTWAHPRVCGENLHDAKSSFIPIGSSPRVRGKLFPLIFCGKTQGLIPACAGKTPNSPVLNVFTWAHPRVCGENLLNEVFVSCTPGSSPRVRGKPAKVSHV